MPKDPRSSIKIEDLNLSPEELAYLVKGAQKYLPPTDEDGNPIENKEN